MICSVIAAWVWAMISAVHWFNLSMLLIYDKHNSFECSIWSSFLSSISNMIISTSLMFNLCQNDHWLKNHMLFLLIEWSLTEKFIVYYLFKVLHQVLCSCLNQYLNRFFCSISELLEYQYIVDSFNFQL